MPHNLAADTAGLSPTEAVESGLRLGCSSAEGPEKLNLALFQNEDRVDNHEKSFLLSAFFDPDSVEFLNMLSPGRHGFYQSSGGHGQPADH